MCSADNVHSWPDVFCTRELSGRSIREKEGAELLVDHRADTPSQQSRASAARISAKLGSDTRRNAGKNFTALNTPSFSVLSFRSASPALLCNEDGAMQTDLQASMNTHSAELDPDSRLTEEASLDLSSSRNFTLQLVTSAVMKSIRNCSRCFQASSPGQEPLGATQQRAPQPQAELQGTHTTQSHEHGWFCHPLLNAEALP